MATKWLEETTRKTVSQEAKGFLYAGFFGAVVGAFCGSVFSFGLGAFLW